MRDACEYGVHVVAFQDVRCRDAQDADATFREPSVASRIMVGAMFVAEAVDFDGQSELRAIEIENVGVGGVLVAE